jgi:hypothetical protein
MSDGTSGSPLEEPPSRAQPGVGWVRTAEFADDLDVTVEYEQLRAAGVVELIDEWEFADAFTFGLDVNQYVRRQQRFEALARRAAEDGRTIKLTDEQTEQVRKRTRRRPGLMRQRETVRFGAPLSADTTNQFPRLLATATDLFEQLRRNGWGFYSQDYGSYPLLREHPDTIVLQEVERLARAHRLSVVVHRCDDIGYDIELAR